MSSQLTLQVEELVLLRCSLLQDEVLEFVSLSLEDVDEWTQIIDAASTGNPVSHHPPCPAQFAIKLRHKAHDAPLSFEFKLSETYPLEPHAFQVVVLGDYLSRHEQQRWQDLIQHQREQLCEINYCNFPVFELASTHLFPILHTESGSASDSPKKSSSIIQPSARPPYAHALLTSHHLKSPQKRRSLQQWSSERKLHGFVKVGHPGIIYCSGSQPDVSEFVNKVKDMQWLALRVRFEEPLSVPQGLETPHGSWVELQKVGEVVEEMKRLGRERFVLDLGIGSGGTRFEAPGHLAQNESKF